MTHRQLIAIATAVAALTLVAATLTGTASAAAKDWHSSDGVCYTSGWCHWSEACYDAFGSCYFDFWCPAGAASAGQCVYYGGFAPYATTNSSQSVSVITGGGFDTNDVVSGGTDIVSGSGCGLGKCISLGGTTSGSQSSTTTNLGIQANMTNPLVRSALFYTQYQNNYAAFH
jgi:hypothetical protein